MKLFLPWTQNLNCSLGNCKPQDLNFWSKEVYNFVVFQGAQKLQAKVQMKSPIY